MSQAIDSRRYETHLSHLNAMRDYGGNALTTGLADDVILDFLQTGFSKLGIAIELAYSRFVELKKTHPEFLALNEQEQIAAAHDGLTNFYAVDAVNPYVAVGAAGPWVVSLKGAIIYDCGGYGMLGFGHAPEAILKAMNQPHVMANIMTANISQVDFVKSMKREVGHTRKGGTPYGSFVCLNSGSEAMSLASRIADINTNRLTMPGAKYDGFDVCGLTLQGSFHGRTDRPARYSDSSMKQYRKHLASFREDDYLLKVEPNNIAALEAVFAEADKDSIFIEAFFMEPVMGEGNPGMPITAEFYARARELTLQHGTMLVVDSIQAGLRAHGVLSMVDYPGFQKLPEPDIESYSKALNGGQYPLSVLALSKRAAETYQQGLYGNTMTTNPRALDIAVAVLDSLSAERRENIRARGLDLVKGMLALVKETDGGIVSAQGTGLLVSCELNQRYKTYGANSTEDYLRRIGLGVIHGGKHSLRFTPVFDISAKEVALILALVKEALLNGPLQEDS